MKKAFIYLYRSWASEVLKSRRTLALWLTMLYPLCAVGLVSLIISGVKFGDENPWPRYVNNLNNIAAFFLPFFLILLIGFYCNIEHKSNTWKHLLVQPLPRWSIYSGKLFMVLSLLALSICFFFLFAFLAYLVLHLCSSKFSSTLYFPEFGRLFLLLMKTYIAASVIITVQYWLSNRLRNLILPIVTGLGMVILPIAMVIILGMAGILREEKLIQKVFSYDPYSYPFTQIFNFSKVADTTVQVFPTLTIIYLGVSLVIFTLSMWEFSRRNIK